MSRSVSAEIVWKAATRRTCFGRSVLAGVRGDVRGVPARGVASDRERATTPLAQQPDGLPGDRGPGPPAAEHARLAPAGRRLQPAQPVSRGVPRRLPGAAGSTSRCRSTARSCGDLTSARSEPRGAAAPDRRARRPAGARPRRTATSSSPGLVSTLLIALEQGSFSTSAGAQTLAAPGLVRDLVSDDRPPLAADQRARPQGVLARPLEHGPAPVSDARPPRRPPRDQPSPVRWRRPTASAAGRASS